MNIRDFFNDRKAALRKSLRDAIVWRASNYNAEEIDGKPGGRFGFTQEERAILEEIQILKRIEMETRKPMF